MKGASGNGIALVMAVVVAVSTIVRLTTAAASNQSVMVVIAVMRAKSIKDSNNLVILVCASRIQ